MKKEELTLYRDLLGEIKTRVQQAQHRAVLSANAELIAMYWDIGRMIAARQKAEGWGAGVIPRLAADLKNELPEEKGFSETNLKRMVQFCREYPGLGTIGAQTAPQLTNPNEKSQEGAQTAPQSDSVEILQQPAAKLPLPPEILFGLPWFHHIIPCQTKNRVFAEYALRDIHKPIGLADYELTRALPEAFASSLPSIEDIEAELADDRGMEDREA